MSPDLCVTSARPVRVANSGKVKRLKRKANSLGTLSTVAGFVYPGGTAKLAKDAGTDPFAKKKRRKAKVAKKRKANKKRKAPAKRAANRKPTAKRTAPPENWILDEKLMWWARKLKLGQTVKINGRTWQKVRGKRGEGRTMIEVARDIRNAKKRPHRKRNSAQYKIVFHGWTPRGTDTRGYNAWDYVDVSPGDRFKSSIEARKALKAGHRGKDSDGVNAIFKVVKA